MATVALTNSLVKAAGPKVVHAALAGTNLVWRRGVAVAVFMLWTVLRSGAVVKCLAFFFLPAWPGPPPVYPPGVFTLEIVDEDALDVSVEAEGELDVTVEVEEP